MFSCHLIIYMYLFKSTWGRNKKSQNHAICDLEMHERSYTNAEHMHHIWEELGSVCNVHSLFSHRPSKDNFYSFLDVFFSDPLTDKYIP